MNKSRRLGSYPHTVGRQRYNKTMELWKAYRFTRFVKKKTKESKEFASEDFLRTQFHLTKRRWLIKRFSLEQVGEIVDYARKKEFIGRYGTTENKLKVSIPNGTELLEMFCVGFIVELTKRYNTFLTVTAIVISIIALSR